MLTWNIYNNISPSRMMQYGRRVTSCHLGDMTQAYKYRQTQNEILKLYIYQSAVYIKYTKIKISNIHVSFIVYCIYIYIEHLTTSIKWF